MLTPQHYPPYLETIHVNGTFFKLIEREKKLFIREQFYGRAYQLTGKGNGNFLIPFRFS